MNITIAETIIIAQHIHTNGVLTNIIDEEKALELLSSALEFKQESNAPVSAVLERIDEMLSVWFKFKNDMITLGDVLSTEHLPEGYAELTYSQLQKKTHKEVSKKHLH